MKKQFLTLFCFASLCALPLLTGCDRTHAAGFSSRQPPLGRQCTVQFRRDLLGTSRELPVAPTAGSINGAETCVRGVLAVVTDEWIVLNHSTLVAGKAIEREYWIPRSAVLLIDMEPK
jgi:hypothetical protein